MLIGLYNYFINNNYYFNKPCTLGISVQYYDVNFKPCITLGISACIVNESQDDGIVGMQEEVAKVGT